MTYQPYPYQLTGRDFLQGRQRALLGDEMGVGKTVQALLALDNSGAIVICPASLKRNWAKECRRWRPDLKPAILNGMYSLRWPEPGEVVITNYETLPGWIADTEGATEEERLFWLPLEPAKNFTLIVDEAHRLRNPYTQQTQRVAGLSKLCGKTWLITGTPLLNKPADLWNLLRAGGMAREAFENEWDFCRLMGIDSLRDKNGRPDSEVPERLRRVMLRRTRKEVLPDLPEKTYTTLEVNGISTRLRKDLDRAWEEWEQLVPGREQLPPMERFSTIRRELASSRIPAMLELVKDHEVEQVPLVVFSAHRDPIDELGKRKGWRTITGDTSNRRRQEYVEQFQEGRLKGIGGTIGAMGVGLTLTYAWKMMFVDLDWVPANNSQAEDRLVRVGQESDRVEIVRMVSPHVLDRHLFHLLIQKRQLCQAAVEI